MMQKSYLHILLLLFIPFSACNTFDDLPKEDSLISWEIFNTDNGLYSDSIYCLHADNYGNLWAGTRDKGLMKYDGSEWINFTISHGLPSNTVTTVYDYFGDIWIGTTLGLSVYDGKQFIDHSLFDSIWITKIHANITGNIWVGTRDAGLIKLKGGSEYDQYYDDSISAKNQINCIDNLFEGTIWAGTNAGLYAINDESTIFFDARYGMPDTITAVLADAWNEIWVADYTSKYVVKVDTGWTKKISLFNGEDFTRIHSLAEDKMGNIWFGLIDGGAVKFDGVGMRTYGVSDGLPGVSIQDIVVDNRGAIWFGSVANGISKFTPVKTYY